MKTKHCVVITGSIGCGKSSVTDILLQRGYLVIDADKIARAQTDEALPEIAKQFGEQYIIDGTLDRKALGRLVFSDENARKTLESIMHPKIKRELFAQIAEAEKRDERYFVDIPLYYERTGYNELSPVAVVYAPRTVQLQRVQARDGISEDEAMAKIDSQIDIEEKKQRADFIIDNSGAKDELRRKIDVFLKELQK